MVAFQNRAEEAAAAAVQAAEDAKSSSQKAAEEQAATLMQRRFRAKQAAAGLQGKAKDLEGAAAAAASASGGAAHSLMASARDALEKTEIDAKDVAAREAINRYAPSPFGPFASCCGAPCAMAALDKAEFVVAKDKRGQMRPAIDTYQSL